MTTSVNQQDRRASQVILRGDEIRRRPEVKSYQSRSNRDEVARDRDAIKSVLFYVTDNEIKLNRLYLLD